MVKEFLPLGFVLLQHAEDSFGKYFSFYFKNIQVLTLLFFSSEKLCKSSLSTWGCYGDCKRSRNTEHFQASSTNRHHPSSVCNCEEFHGKSLFQSTSSTNEPSTPPSWRPLLLFIPLRLGLTEVNPDYYPSLKVSSCS